MKKMITSVIIAVMAAIGLSSCALVPTYAAGSKQAGSASQYVKDVDEDQGSTDLMETVKTAINVVVGIVGIIAVVMIVVGGITFATSSGDTTKTKKGKDTVLFGVIGLAVALLAFAIVNFVLQNVFGQ